MNESKLVTRIDSRVLQVPVQIQLQNINDLLLYNASFVNNIGLMHGKMGICIYFYHLARKTQNKVFEEYAGELIDEIYEEINANTPLDFENGLAGIGWGIEYLVQNNFINADTNEILSEFDDKIFFASLYSQPLNLSLLNGKAGLGAYFLMRLKNPNSSNDKIITLTIKHYLILLIDTIDNISTDISKITKEPEAFNITWDYPVLLWFLSGLYDLNIYNHKIGQLINRLLTPLHAERKLPNLHCNRLLLSLALLKLSKACEIVKINDLIEYLISNTDPMVFYEEIPKYNNSIRKGKAGIVWIFERIVEFKTPDSSRSFKWLSENQTLAFEKHFSSKEEDISLRQNVGYGILEGITGLMLKYL